MKLLGFSGCGWASWGAAMLRPYNVWDVGLVGHRQVGYRGACAKVEDGTGFANWRAVSERAGLPGGADVAGGPRGVLHVRGAVSGQAAAFAAGDVASHGRGRSGFTDSFPDHIFIGLILALQAAYELRKFGAMNLVATAVAISMTRELGPLITAIVVIGRSGSAFAAEIGTMKVTEEIDALETMAISPIHFLVTPKFLAMIVMLPCLTIWANSMGILGGALFGVTQADFTWARYIQTSVDCFVFADIVTGLIKSVMFGITITAVGCLEGMSTGAGAEQVGHSTTRAVVMSIFMVVLVDLVFTMLFFFVGGGIAKCEVAK